MAVWQAVFWLVPRESTTEQRDDAWLGVERIVEQLRAFDDVLPPSDSWSPDILHWGAYESHDVEVSMDGRDVASIRVRVDLRAPAVRPVIEALVAAAITLGAVCETEDGLKIPPDAAALLDWLRGTPAARFVTSPSAFFQEIRERSL